MSDRTKVHVEELLAAGVTMAQLQQSVVVMSLIGRILERAAGGDTTVGLLALASLEHSIDYQRRCDEEPAWSDLRPMAMRWLAAEEEEMRAAEETTS